MTEILFILTTIFVAYVVYNIVNEKQATNNAIKPDAVAPEAPPVVTAPSPSVQPPPVAVAVPPKARKAPTVKPVAANVPKGSIRDPKTGEVAAIANNYRFMKRWIKEALVAEGLLTKVYKNNELDAETEALIKQALAKLEGLDKYQA